MESTRPSLCIPAPTATTALQNIMAYISRYAGERAVTRARFITTESDGEKRETGIDEGGGTRNRKSVPGRRRVFFVSSQSLPANTGQEYSSN
jgi:hypothetical protein